MKAENVPGPSASHDYKMEEDYDEEEEDEDDDMEEVSWKCEILMPIYVHYHACISIAINCISARFIFMTNDTISIASDVHVDSKEKWAPIL